MSEKDDVFNYVMNSPENTNPAVLASLLNGIEVGGGAVIDDEHSSTDTTYSSAKIESVAGANKLPTVTTSDNGKTVSVVEGAWSKENVINIVGTFDSTDGKLESITLPTGFTRNKLEKYLIDGYKFTLTMQTRDHDILHFSMDSYIRPGENDYGATLDSQGIWFTACIFHKGNANPPTIADPYVCTRYFVFISLRDKTGLSDTLFYHNVHYPQ